MQSSALIFTVAGTGQVGYTGDGGVARRAELNQPFDLTLDRQGNLYVSEADNHCVRRIEHGSGIITTVAGTGKAGYSGDGGPATKAELHSPYGIALDRANNLYIVDRLNAEVVKILAMPEVKKQMADQGAEPNPEKPAQLAAFMKAETAKWAKVVKASGATVD